MRARIQWRVKLCLQQPSYYRVKAGQTLVEIARAFKMPPRALAAHNALVGEVEAGQVLALPPCGGNLYTVRGGESRTLLCGSPQKFEEKNGTPHLYPGQSVWL